MLLRSPRVIDSAEPLAIDGERRAGRHAARLGARACTSESEPPHLLFQQADGVIELVAAERVAADQLGEPIGLVHRGRHAPAASRAA